MIQRLLRYAYLLMVIALTACGGGSDPFYSQPPAGPGGGATPPVFPFGTNVPVPRAPVAALPAPVRTPPAGPRVLILYDEPEDNQYARLGRGFGIMLQNLLGHFDAEVQAIPVQQYRNGSVNEYHTTFYIGWATGQTVPTNFLSDVSRTNARVVWLRSNLEQMNLLDGFSTRSRWGFVPWGSRFFDAGPTPAGSVPSFFSTVYYKNLSFQKRATIYEGEIAADPEVFITEVTDRTRARVHAVIGNPATGATAPYVLQSDNFWFVADLPFNHIHARDRYLVFADLLHDMLGVDHAESHQAMIRLEDIDAKVDPDNFKPVVDYLHARGIPFSMATIPHYKDPYGSQNNGVPTDIPLAEATTLRLALDYALARGGEIVQHGLSHQSDTYRNGFPGTGGSGLDYEFWDVMRNAPMAGDSVAWALNRVNTGLRQFLDLGYQPVAWETPHYHGAPSVLQAVEQVYQTAYQRHTYYTSVTPNLTPGLGADFELWQFFPYVIERDIYGLRVLPENLGNLQYYQFGVEEELTPQDVVRNAEYARVVRDGFASFFIHPFLIGEITGGRGMRDLQEIVTGLEALGYTWTSPSRLDNR